MSTVKMKHRSLAAANTKWKVYLDHLVDDHGNEIPDYMVLESCDPHPDCLTGVAVLPILDDRFVLLRSYRHPLGCELWEVPRGFVDRGEPPAQAALRELTEESRLTCAADDLIPLGTYTPEAATMAARGALFAATRCRGVPHSTHDEIGLGEIHQFNSKEMATLVESGGLEDAGTLIAYYRFCAWRSRTSGC
jgi:8-oxo-dGTP pyrophosphatase MutT (NUDIX family)